MIRPAQWLAWQFARLSRWLDAYAMNGMQNCESCMDATPRLCLTCARCYRCDPPGEKRFVSGDQVMREYVPGYKKPLLDEGTCHGGHPDCLGGVWCRHGEKGEG